MNRAKTVDQYIRQSTQWGDELRALREVLRATSLDEEIKWGGPCYTYKGKNVVGIGAFKSYFGLWFHQGALLSDDKKVLINAQEGVTKALRQWRMASAKDIKPTIIKRYVREAMGQVDAGKEIKPERGKAVDVPSELAQALHRRKGAMAAFRKLRVGLQREYAAYISSAKRDETKKRRIAKILPKPFGIGAFKSYFGLWFHQGALLSDDKKVLINAQEGVTKALRQWRMASARDIKPTIIKRYVKEAMGQVDAGKEIKPERGKPVDVPSELAQALRRRKGAIAAFRKLRVGLQREYAEYISSAKRDETKERRIAKILPMVSAGLGLNDKYRS